MARVSPLRVSRRTCACTGAADPGVFVHLVAGRGRVNGNVLADLVELVLGSLTSTKWTSLDSCFILSRKRTVVDPDRCVAAEEAACRGSEYETDSESNPAQPNTSFN